MTEDVSTSVVTVDVVVHSENGSYSTYSELGELNDYDRSSVVDADHVAMIGSSDTLSVLTISNMNRTVDSIGIMFGLSSLNGKVAVSTLSSGIMIYPLGILTNVSESMRGSQAKIQIWPNPASTVINIVLPSESNGPLHLTITNLLGELILHQNIANLIANESLCVEVSEIKRGCYYLKLVTSEGIFSSSIIIN